MEEQLETMARQMADELIEKLNRVEQAAVWVRVKQHLIDDANAKIAAEKQAGNAFKHMK